MDVNYFVYEIGASDLKVSEMDDWADSEDEEMSDEPDEDEEADKKKKSNRLWNTDYHTPFIS